MNYVYVWCYVWSWNFSVCYGMDWLCLTWFVLWLLIWKNMFWTKYSIYEFFSGFNYMVSILNTSVMYLPIVQASRFLLCKMKAWIAFFKSLVCPQVPEQHDSTKIFLFLIDNLCTSCYDTLDYKGLWSLFESLILYLDNLWDNVCTFYFHYIKEFYMDCHIIF